MEELGDLLQSRLYTICYGHHLEIRAFVYVGGGYCPSPPPRFPAESNSNEAKTTLSYSPIYFMLGAVYCTVLFMFTFPFHLHQDPAGRAGSGSVQFSLLACKAGPEKLLPDQIHPCKGTGPRD